MKNNRGNLLTGIFTTISLILLCNLGFTQEIMNERTFNDFVRLRQEGSLVSIKLTENDIAGSPYLKDDFVLGSLLTLENIKYKDVPLRYNIYNDDMEYKVGADSYLAISNPNSLKEIRIGKKTFIHTNKKTKKGKPFGYYEVLSNGKIQLLSRYIVVFNEATLTKGYGQGRPANFSRNSNRYYLKIGDLEPQEISNKKDIGNIFGEKSKPILGFVKKQKINVRKKDGLIKLVKFINTLD